MSISPITSAIPVFAPEASPNPAPSQTAPSAPASLPNDTVTLSPAAMKASQAGDVDHDGDSH